MLGADEAATLMAHLPPTGWGDGVTHDHLDTVIQAQDVRMDARFTRLESRIDAVRHELLAATRGGLVAALAQQTVR